nr:immunoglobulin heavy chain junction region [Mus musculus]MBK4187939.1 immunoglobulin heavy chain junction region [Mus musculus]
CSRDNSDYDWYFDVW